MSNTELQIVLTPTFPPPYFPISLGRNIIFPVAQANTLFSLLILFLLPHVLHYIEPLLQRHEYICLHMYVEIIYIIFNSKILVMLISRIINHTWKDL